MSATSHAPTKSSDTPWIVGSLVVFGPALLYLLSPSARKNTHGVHHDYHDFPALKTHEGHQAPKAESNVAVPVEDGEGTEGTGVAEANVDSSTVSQDSNVPNDSTSPESNGETKVEDVSASEEPATTRVSESTMAGNSGTSNEKGGEGPTNLSKAPESAKE